MISDSFTSASCLMPNAFSHGFFMATAIYKPGQGYWTRLMSAIALSLLVLMGVAWLWRLLATVRVGTWEPVYIQAVAACVIMAVFGYIGYLLIGRKPRVVDFMIATESEMKKVNWSSKREIMGSTWVVIGLTVFLALVCFTFDSLFQWIFQVMNVLETTQTGQIAN
jgi:preprotein translocase subunit SecE